MQYISSYTKGIVHQVSGYCDLYSSCRKHRLPKQVLTTYQSVTSGSRCIILTARNKPPAKALARLIVLGLDLNFSLRN